MATNYIFSDSSSDNQILLGAGSGKYITDILHVKWTDDDTSYNGEEPTSINNTNDFLNLLKHGIEQVHQLINHQTLNEISWATTSASSIYGKALNFPNIKLTYEDGSTSTISATASDVQLSRNDLASSNAGTYSNITATYNNKTTTNKLNYTISKASPTLTINNPVLTTIADGSTTTITVTSSVAGMLTLTTSSGEGWNATSSSARTAATSHTITVSNLTSTTTAGSIAKGGIIATFTPTNTTNYNTLTSQSVLKQNITLSAKIIEQTYYWYVGTTDPSTMTSISPIVTDTRSSGWRKIGTTKPTSSTYTSSNMLWDGTNNEITFSRNYSYIAVPYTPLQMYDIAGNNGMFYTLQNNGNPITIANVQYYIYKSDYKTGGFAMNIYNK